MTITANVEVYDDESRREKSSSKVISYRDAMLFFAYMISGVPKTTCELSEWGFEKEESSEREYIINGLLEEAKEYVHGRQEDLYFNLFSL